MSSEKWKWLVVSSVWPAQMGLGLSQTSTQAVWQAEWAEEEAGEQGEVNATTDLPHLARIQCQ